MKLALPIEAERWFRVWRYQCVVGFALERELWWTDLIGGRRMHHLATVTVRTEPTRPGPFVVSIVLLWFCLRFGCGRVR